MSFRYRNFKLIGLNFSGIPTMWSYTTDDTIAQVTAEGYFDDPRLDVEPVDIIKVQASDGPYEVQLVGGVASVVGATDRAKDLSEFGVIYGSSESQHEAFQSAIDSCESRGIAIIQSGDVTLKGNVYFGNTKFFRRSGVINIVSGSDFVETGTASQKSEGVILTKSSAGAGYGYQPVDIEINGGLYVNFSRSDSGAPLAAILLQNISSISGDTINVSTGTGVDLAKTPLDFYKNCKNVQLDSIYITCDNVDSIGGLWIRNTGTTESEATENFNIGSIYIDHTGIDEAIAIYNFVDAAYVKNINIGQIYVKAKNRGQAVSVMNKIGASPGVVSGVTIGSVTIDVDGGGSNTFALKAENAEPYINHCEINLNDITAATGSIYAANCISTNEEKPVIGNLKINVNSQPASGNVDLINGNWEIRNTEVKGASSVRRVAKNFNTLLNCDIDVDYTNMSLSRGRKVTGKVRGKMEGVISFEGTHILDTKNYSGTQWFIHSSFTSGVLYPEPLINYRASVIVDSASGSDTIANIVSGNFTGSDVCMDIHSRIDNTAHDITIGNDFNGGDVALTYYDSVEIKSTGAARRSKTLTV